MFERLVKMDKKLGVSFVPATLPLSFCQLLSVNKFRLGGEQENILDKNKFLDKGLKNWITK